MESALIVSRTEKSISFFTETLHAVSCNQIVTLPSCAEARRMLLDRDFDIVIINAPLQDESGESLSQHIAGKGICQVILVVQSEHYEEMASVTEDFGVMTIAKPLSRSVFWATLKLAKSAQNRLRQMQQTNSRLTQRIEDIRIVDRAKCILISHMGMSEQAAHRYIEKQAMDMRSTKKSIAEGIIKTYEN